MLNCRTWAAMVALAAVLTANPPAVAQEEGHENEPTHFICDFAKGYAWTYEEGKYRSEPPSDLKLEIDSIDLEQQSASLIMNGQRGADLKIVRAINANHFLEVVNEGFLNLTTIYDRDAATGQYPAVHSRHFGLFGQPVFAQYAGSCIAQP